MTATTPIEEKIAALLRQAEDSAVTPAEAEAFSAMAEKLMIRYGIEQLTVDVAKLGRSQVTEKIIRDELWFSGVYAQANAHMLGHVIMGFPNLRTVVSRGDKQHAVYVIGYESDVRAVRALLDSLVIQANLALTAWINQARDDGSWSELTGTQKFKARRTFLVTFGQTVRSRIARLHHEEYATTTGAEVALRDRGSEVDAFVATDVGRTGKTRALKSGGVNAARAGRAAGERASVGQREVRNQTGGRRLDR
jgi:hypothetical protein